MAEDRYGGPTGPAPPPPPPAAVSRRAPALGEIRVKTPGAVGARNGIRRRPRHNGEVTELSDEVRTERENELRALVDLMRPAVQADGGDLELTAFDVEAGTVEVQLRGACSSCAISSATLQGGVERILKSRLAWVTDVTGGVDEDVDLTESAAMGRGAYVPRLP